MALSQPVLITRKKRIPLHWVFYAQVPFVMAVAANYVTGAPFLYAMKKFIDNPAAITFLLSIEVFVTMLGGPFANWLSDRVWTRHGRRKPFVVLANIPRAASIFLMPFAPDLMTLIILRWCYGIFGDIGSPNQALTMEIVPPKQRGMGSGFYKLQGQLVNLFFFGLVIGRFDDVFFTGPFYDLLAVSGETLIFFAGGFLFLSLSVYTWFGIHEVEPPTRQRLADDRRPGENVLKLFFRVFFRDVFHQSLLPLYLLLMVGTLANVGLGILGPLLYTEQWGYSLQQMGTNVAIGAAIGIGTALLAGWVADKTSKMLVYSTALVLVLLCRIVWTVYVACKPDHRPELFEILVFGSVTNVFGLVAAAAAFPLILEYVERNRLGTAGAGMGLFDSTIRNGFTMFVGVWILWWSLFFLPQAGDRLQLVFKEELNQHDVTARLAEAGYPADILDLKPLHRPGVDGETSRHWRLRRPVEGAGDVHKRIKDLDTQISKLQLKLQRPSLDDAERDTVRSAIATLRDQQRTLRSELTASAEAFREEMLRIFGPVLVEPASKLVAASSDELGSRLTFTLAVVEPVTPDLAKDLERVMETTDLALTAAPGKFTYKPALQVVPVTTPSNGVTIALTRDTDFVALERALVAAELRLDSAYDLTAELIQTIRGSSSQSGDAYEIRSATATRARLDFDLHFPTETPPLESVDLQSLFAALPGVTTARVTGAPPVFTVSLDLAPQPAATPTDTPISERLRDLLPTLSETDIRSLEKIIQRVEDSATARPIFLTTVRPVVRSDAADREYDYFFSMQYFMIATDLLGIAIIFFILRLEKRGVIRRKGAEEDENR